MASAPVKGKKKKGKNVKKEVFNMADVPRKVDLKEEDLASEQSWPGSETSSGSKHSYFGPLIDTTNLQASVSSSASEMGFSGSKGAISQGSSSEMGLNGSKGALSSGGEALRGSSSATEVCNSSEPRDSPLLLDSIFDRPQTASRENSPVVSLGSSGKNARSVSASSSLSASSRPVAGDDIISDRASNRDRTCLMDDVSDDDDAASRYSDASGAPEFTESVFSDRALSGQVQSPFHPGALHQHNNHQDLNAPLDVLTGNIANPKKKKSNKKKGILSKPSEIKSKTSAKTSKPVEIHSKPLDIDPNPVKTNVKPCDINSKPSEANPRPSDINFQQEIKSEPILEQSATTRSPSPKTLQPEIKSKPLLEQSITTRSPSPKMTLQHQTVTPDKKLPESVTSPVLSPELPPGLGHVPAPASLPLSNQPRGQSPQLSTPPPKLCTPPLPFPPPIQQLYKGQNLFSYPPPPSGASLNYPPPPQVSMPTFPPLSSTGLLSNITMGRTTLVERAVNTDPCIMDWNEVEALMNQLESEKRTLVSKLENERKARMKLDRDQSEQMEQLINQMQHQEEMSTETNRSLLDERELQQAQCLVYQNDIAELEKRIKALESLQKSTKVQYGEKDQAVVDLRETLEAERRAQAKEKAIHEADLKEMSHKCGMDMLRAERAEIDLLKVKLEISLKNFELSTSRAEQQQNLYKDHINRLQKENTGAPQELLDVYNNWTKIVAEIRIKQEKCKTEFESQIRSIKQGAHLASLPVINIAEQPGLPSRPKQDTPTHRPVPVNLVKKTPNFNAAPGSSRPAGFTLGGSLGPSRHSLNTVLASGRSKQNSFNKIMSSLTNMFPNHRQTDIEKFIMRLREGRGNTLSGMNLQKIVSSVAEMILAESQRHKGVSCPVPPSTPWASSTETAMTDEIFQEEEDPCVICYNELTAQPQQTMECGHRYHKHCIRRWMQEQSTCPTCRKHVLLREDFPALS